MYNVYAVKYGGWEWAPFMPRTCAPLCIHCVCVCVCVICICIDTQKQINSLSRECITVRAHRVGVGEQMNERCQWKLNVPQIYI